MNRFYGLGFTRLADDQVAYFGRAAAGQREGMQFIVMAESDSQLQWLWGRLNPSVPLDPKGVHNCGLTYGSTLRRFLRPAEADGTAPAEESTLPVEISARRQQLRRLEKTLVEIVQADQDAPQPIRDALSWVVGQLNAPAVPKPDRTSKSAAPATADRPS